MKTIKFPITSDTSIYRYNPYANFYNLWELGVQSYNKEAICITLFKFPQYLFYYLQFFELIEAKVYFNMLQYSVKPENLMLYKNTENYNCTNVTWNTKPKSLPLNILGYKNKNYLVFDIKNILTKDNFLCFKNGFQIISTNEFSSIFLASSRSKCLPFLELKFANYKCYSPYIVAFVDNDSIQTNRVVPFNGIIPFNSVNSANEIELNRATGELSISHPGLYVFDWWINYSGTDIDNSFEIQLLPPVGSDVPTNQYPASSVFKTGQLSGSAIVSPVAGGRVRLVNRTTGTITLAIGNGMITAGISIVSIPTVNGIQGYLLGTTTTIPANGIIPYDDPAGDPTNGAVTLDTTTNNGRITFNKPGTYAIDWWLAISSATGATEVVLEVIDSSSTVIGASYSAVSTNTHITGFTVLTVSEAQIGAGYYVCLYNSTVDTSSTAIPIGLKALTKNSSIRVIGNAA